MQIGTANQGCTVYPKCIFIAISTLQDTYYRELLELRYVISNARSIHTLHDNIFNQSDGALPP